MNNFLKSGNVNHIIFVDNNISFSLLLNILLQSQYWHKILIFFIMKNLKGLKNFSSLENKKLKDLKMINGGETNRSAPSGYENCSDVDYYKDADNSPGDWHWNARLTICGPEREGTE